MEHGGTADGHPIHRVVAVGDVVELQNDVCYLSAIVENAVRLTGIRATLFGEENWTPP